MGLSASLRGKALQCLAGSFRIAAADGLVSANPCDGVTVKQLAHREARFLSIEELKRLALAAGESPRWC